MNWSLLTADRATYSRIVAVALLGATLVAIAAICAQRLPSPPLLANAAGSVAVLLC